MPTRKSAAKKTQVSLEPEADVEYVSPEIAAAMEGEQVSFTVEITTE